MKINKIAPGLYIGDTISLEQQNIPQQNGITHVLTAHQKNHDEIQGHLSINCPDNIHSDVTKHFTRCFKFIHQARKHGSVLIRCANGMSSGVVIATAYLATVTRLPWENVLTYIEQKVKCASPNIGFRIRLRNYQKERIEVERRNLVESFQVVDAFGDTSLIEATGNHAVFET